MASQHARGIRPVATWYRFTARRETDDRAVELSDARTRSSALRALLLSLLRLRRDVNAFYFGVLRCVATGNTGGVTGAEAQGREGR